MIEIVRGKFVWGKNEETVFVADPNEPFEVVTNFNELEADKNEAYKKALIDEVRSSDFNKKT